MNPLPPLVFLDLDGVLNHHDWWLRRGDREPEFSSFCNIYELDPDSCRRLQDLCTATDAKIVICSSWRKMYDLAAIRAVFAQRGIIAEIIGRTPCLRWHESKFERPWREFGRGLECQWWLQHYLGNEVTCQTRFVCVDDDGDYGDLRGKLVNTRFATGLTDLEVEHMKQHLSETLMDSPAAGGRGRVLFEYETLGLEPWWSEQPGPFGPTGEGSGSGVVGG